MGEIFRIEHPSQPLPFSGERFTSQISGQIEIEHYHRYSLAREFCRGKVVLDVASGEGYGAAALAQVASRVYGSELDFASTSHARAAYPKDNLFFATSHGCRLPWRDRSFDVVVSFETLEHLSEQDLFLGEIKRVLRSDGLLIISTPDRDVYSPAGRPANEFHVCELTRGEFKALLGKHFHQVSISLQRPMMGSVLVPETSSLSQTKPLIFERRGLDHIEFELALPRALYLIGVASDSAVTQEPFSLYIETSHIDGPKIEADELAVRLKHSEEMTVELELRLKQSEEKASAIEADVHGQIQILTQERDSLAAQTSHLQELNEHAAASSSNLRAELESCQLNLKRESDSHARTLKEAETKWKSSTEREVELARRSESLKASNLNLTARELAYKFKSKKVFDLANERLCQLDTIQAQVHILETQRARAEVHAKYLTEQLSVFERDLSRPLLKLIWDLSIASKLLALKRLFQRRKKRVGNELHAPLQQEQMSAEAALIAHSGLFDETWYSGQISHISLDAAGCIAHYLTLGSREGRTPNPLFSPHWYRNKYLDVSESGVEPLVHYISFGWLEGRWPHPLFDPEWYLLQYPEVKTSGLEPLAHFLDLGGKQGYSPNPWFSPDWYLSQIPDRTNAPNLTISSAEANSCALFFHYLQRGSKQGFWPNSLFDPAWYRRKYAGAMDAGLEPLEHYVSSGSSNGCKPNPLFDPPWYRETYFSAENQFTEPLGHYLGGGFEEGNRPNPLFDTPWYQETYLAGTANEPLSHYLSIGSAEGNRPNPLFDPSWYRVQYPEVAVEWEPLCHYITIGHKAGFRPNCLFDPAWYLVAYSDVAAEKKEALCHYLDYGSREGRRPNRLFDPQWYLSQYPDVEAAGLHALYHYLAYGSAEGRRPIELFDPAWYRSEYQHLIPSHLEAFAHYVFFGEQAGLKSAPGWNENIRERRIRALGLLEPPRPVRLAAGVVSYNSDEFELSRCLRSLKLAWESAAIPESYLSIFLIENGTSREWKSDDMDFKQLDSQGNVGFGTAHNTIMKQAFEAGASHYLAVNPDGALEANALYSLLQMSRAAKDKALIEALQFPEEHPKDYAANTFETPWASGACLLIPKSLYDEIGGFDEDFFLYCEDVDYSWRARVSGFRVLTCPRALFFHPVSDRKFDLARHERFLTSGLRLAKKWGSDSFQQLVLDELKRHDLEAPSPEPALPLFDRSDISDFSHRFYFANPRW